MRNRERLDAVGGAAVLGEMRRSWIDFGECLGRYPSDERECPWMSILLIEVGIHYLFSQGL